MTQISSVFSTLTNSTVAGWPSPARLRPPGEAEGEVRGQLQLLDVAGELLVELVVELEEEEGLLEVGALVGETLEVAEVVEEVEEEAVL